ncbi:DUF2147 domain-containing protein [Bosea sp. BK604]|uniref:DUF2147 domain-containing protein n=1 Tax=Bosea sp. BK604 TaxID=2512180 RepID=UPI00104ADB68|nr:DUF2147 domain-containing protein [Bosea sp. BK604]TCR63056.1 uncharacterized protein (DUF2147 family) [Bosea sp. BK604]
MTRLLLALALAAASAGGAAAGTIDGTWLRDDGNARVRIAPCGDKTCATNLWIGDTSKGEAAGDRLILTLARQPDGSFSGTAYDPKRDWTYSMTITATPGALITRGCIVGRLICRDVNWKAAD